MPVPHPVLNGGTVGMMSGENPMGGKAEVPATHENLVQTLRGMNLKHEETHGHYGAPERSVIIHGPTREQMQWLGKRFGQEAVVFSQGGRHQLLYTGETDPGLVREVAPGQAPHELTANAPADQFTYIPGHGYLHINFDFNKPAQPHVEQMAKSELGLPPAVGLRPHPLSYDWHDGSTEHYKAAPVPSLVKAEGNDQAAGVGAPDYHRFAAAYGQVKPGQPSNLLHYRYENKLPEIEKLVAAHGYKVHYAGGKYGKPDLANKNYTNGHLMIYDPSPESGGDFGHESYTRGWRQIHELAHALTLPEVNKIYGEGRRIGKLGTHRTLNEAQRAVHWEHLAAHKQRELSKAVGVHLSNEDFHRERNTVMHDALHRAVTGKFTEPSAEGFIPHSHEVPLSHSLDMLRDEGQKLGLSGLHDTLKSKVQKSEPVIYSGSLGSPNVANEKKPEYNESDVVAIGVTFLEKRINELAKSLKDLRERELKKAVVPTHRHTPGTTVSGGVEDVGTLNPPGKLDALKAEKAELEKGLFGGQPKPPPYQRDDKSKVPGHVQDAKAAKADRRVAHEARVAANLAPKSPVAVMGKRIVGKVKSLLGKEAMDSEESSSEESSSEESSSELEKGYNSPSLTHGSSPKPAEPVAPPKPVSDADHAADKKAAGLGKAELLCKPCGKVHKAGACMDKAVDKIVVRGGGKEPKPVKGADHTIAADKDKVVMETKKAMLSDAKGKQKDNGIHPESVLPDDKKSKVIPSPGSGGKVKAGKGLKKDALESTTSTKPQIDSEPEPECKHCGSTDNIIDRECEKCASKDMKKAGPAAVPQAKAPKVASHKGATGFALSDMMTGDAGSSAMTGATGTLEQSELDKAGMSMQEQHALADASKQAAPKAAAAPAVKLPGPEAQAARASNHQAALAGAFQPSGPVSLASPKKAGAAAKPGIFGKLQAKGLAKAASWGRHPVADLSGSNDASGAGLHAVPGSDSALSPPTGQTGLPAHGDAGGFPAPAAKIPAPLGGDIGNEPTLPGQGGPPGTTTADKTPVPLGGMAEPTATTEKPGIFGRLQRKLKLP